MTPLPALLYPYCSTPPKTESGPRETLTVGPSGAFIVRFSKNLPIEFEVQEVKDWEASFDLFLAAKRLQEGLKKDQFVVEKENA